MRLTFRPLDDWLARASYRFDCALPPFSVTDGVGRRIDITPFVALCHDVAIIGGDWIPMYRDGDALLEQMVHSPHHYLTKAYNVVHDARGYALVPPIEAIDDDAVLIGGRSNYYHWVIDFMPRLLMARQAVGDRTLIVNEELPAYQIESLNALGFGLDRLVRVGDRRVVRPRSVVIPSCLASITVPHRGLPALLRAAFPPTQVGRSERIYITRADAAVRRLTNERELVALLERFGFEAISSAHLGFQAQVDLFAGARAVIALHGAGMANMVFAPAGCDVIEISAPDVRPTFFSALAHFCRHRHEFVPARLAAPPPDGRPINSDWEADLDAMEATLRKRFAPR